VSYSKAIPSLLLYVARTFQTAFRFPHEMMSFVVYLCCEHACIRFSNERAIHRTHVHAVSGLDPCTNNQVFHLAQILCTIHRTDVHALSELDPCTSNQVVHLAQSPCTGCMVETCFSHTLPATPGTFRPAWQKL
jgi:hypothetical protein